MSWGNWFGGGDKQTTQTAYETTNTYRDESASAAEGSVAVAAGGKINSGLAIESGGPVNIETSDPRVTLAALDTNAAIAQSAMNSVTGLATISAQERQDVLSTTGTAIQSQQGVTDQLAALASAALERSQTPDSQTMKTMLYVAGAVAVLIALLVMSNRKHQ